MEYREGFSNQLEEKSGNSKGGLNDYRIPKAWGGRTVWNSEGKGGLSSLEFPKARGGLDEDATRGRVWIFSGNTHYYYYFGHFVRQLLDLSGHQLFVQQNH